MDNPGQIGPLKLTSDLTRLIQDVYVPLSGAGALENVKLQPVAPS